MESLDHDLSALRLNNSPSESSSDTDGLVVGLGEDQDESQNDFPSTLMDLPTEIHLAIVEYCLLAPHHIPEPEWTPEGRHVHRDRRRLLGGSLRDLTLVSKYFRTLTAPYLFESICISDNSTATKEDKLRRSHEQLVDLPTYEWLHHMKKFTISLGRTPNPHHSYGGQDFIEMLNYMQWPTTMRYVFETKLVPFTILNDVHHLLKKWRRFGMDLMIFKVRQLELSCVWGSHNWDFQFLTWPYLNTERIWLDFDTDHLIPESLALDRLRNLQYVMHSAHPNGIFYTHADLDKFQGFAAPDGRRPPFLRQLGNTMRHVKHLALCGVLKGRVTEIAPLLRDMRSLEQLDITDQQAITQEEMYRIRAMVHPISDYDWAMKYSALIRHHPNNIDRIVAAETFFETLPNLQRICFVRDQIGVIYKALRDEDTGAIERIDKVEEIRERFHYLKFESNNSAAWRCGFPNRLGYKLWDRAGDSWCRADFAFWVDPAWLAGDASVVPHHLRFEVAERVVFGSTSPEGEERMAWLEAKNAERVRRRGERRRRDAFIHAQWASDRAAESAEMNEKNMKGKKRNHEKTKTEEA